MRYTKVAVTFAAASFLQSCGAAERHTDEGEGETIRRDDTVEEIPECTQSVEPGIVVEIRDALTDAPIADSANAVITDGEYVEHLSSFDIVPPGISFSTRSGADERPGTYLLRVTRVGYQAWQRSGIEVFQGTCHVKTLTLQVRLNPEP